MATLERSTRGLGSRTEWYQTRFGSWEERIAYTEAWTRSLNVRCAESALGLETMPNFRCECWRQGCTERVLLSGEDWTLVRAEPCRFAVAPDHVAQNFEAVVKTFPRFWLIEKFGKAGEIAAELAGSELRLTRQSA